MTAPPLPPLDPASIDWTTARYQTYDRLRELGGVHQRATPADTIHNEWYVLAYHDATAILDDPRFVRRQPGAVAERPARRTAGLMELDQHWLIHQDPPAHTTDRQWLARALAADFNDVAAERAATLLSTLLEDQRASDVEFVATIAQPLTARLIAELIGFSAAQGKALAETIVTMLSPDVTHAQRVDARTTIAGALVDVVDTRSTARENDVISRLIALRGDATAAQLVSTCLFLLTSGYGALADLLGSSVLMLATHRSMLPDVASDAKPARRFVDETMRLETPIQMIDRWASVDMALAGRSLRAGDRIYVVLGAANRDPAHFASASAFQPARSHGRDLAFGDGAHACLGVGFASTVASAAIRCLAQHAPRVSTTVEPVWRPGMEMRSLARLTIRMHE